MKNQYLIYLERTKNVNDLKDVQNRYSKIMRILQNDHNLIDLDSNTYLVSTDKSIFKIKEQIRECINDNYTLLIASIEHIKLFCAKSDIKEWIDKNIDDKNQAKLSMDGC